MHTKKNAKIENITCDGNGAYLETKTSERYYRLLVKDGCYMSKIVHNSDDEILIKGTVLITKQYG